MELKVENNNVLINMVRQITYMGSEYNSSLSFSYRMYFDVEYLYGTAMEHALVIGNFEWFDNNLFEYYNDNIR